MKLIKINFNNSCFDTEDVYLPLQDNLDEECVDTFEELKEKWESKKWDYHHYPTVSLVDTDDIVVGTLELFHGYPKTEIPDYVLNVNTKNVTKCDEFGVWFYDDLGYSPDFYARPFDNNPQDLNFCCWFASDCYAGNVYSKDFAYHTCDSCNRTICYQNPSNGWMVQFKTHDCSMECNKCAEERLLDEGIDVEDVLYSKTLGDGLFMNRGELESNGWTKATEDSMLVGSGRFGGYGKLEPVLDKIKELHDNGNKVFIEYDDMAIGGLGGYINLWIK